MRYLIDTHILLWALYDSRQLSNELKDTLIKSKCCVSIASLWEIAIKNSIGKLKLEQSVQDIAFLCKKKNVDIVGISPQHCDIVRELPMIHKDPFDRIIIAQAQADGYIIVTQDEMILQYDVNTMDI